MFLRSFNGRIYNMDYFDEIFISRNNEDNVDEDGVTYNISTYSIYFSYIYNNFRSRVKIYSCTSWDRCNSMLEFILEEIKNDAKLIDILNKENETQE